MNPELPGVNMYITTCLHGVDLRFTPRCYLCKPWPDDSPVWKVASPGHVHEGEWCALCVEAGGEARELSEARDTLDEGVDGVDCDWDEHGKCRCRAATPASLDVERLVRVLTVLDPPSVGWEDGQLIHVSTDATYERSRQEWAAAIAREYAALEEPTP